MMVLQSKIKLRSNTNNIYVTKQENYKYVVSDSSLATEEGMFILSKKEKTTVKILDEKRYFYDGNSFGYFFI